MANTNEKLVQAAEHFALNEWMCEWPASMSYDEVIMALESGAYVPEIELWELTEKAQPVHTAAELIETTKCHYIRSVTELLEELK